MLSSSVWRGHSHWWFTAGLLAGGLTSSLVAVTVGSLIVRPLMPTTGAVGMVAAAALLIAMNDLGMIRLPLPQNSRQVPQTIADDGQQYGALQFGFEMGTGVRTFMTSGLPHLLALCVLLLAAWHSAVFAGAAFGAGRAWMTLNRNSHPDAAAWDHGLHVYEKRILVVLIATSVGVLAVIARSVF